MNARRISAWRSRPARQRVSIDFTEGRLACGNDPNNPWTGRNMLSSFVDLNNRVIDRFSPAERKNIGIHTCPGGDCDSTHSADVDYADLLPSMFKMNAGYFLIQLASEKDKERVYKLIGQHSRADANGVPQVCFIGVINPQSPRIETPQEVCDDLLLASRPFPKSVSARPMTAVSRRSALTSSPSTARRMLRGYRVPEDRGAG